MNKLQLYSLYHVLQAGGNRYTKKKTNSPAAKIVQQSSFYVGKAERKRRKSEGQLEQGSKHLTLPAYLHLVLAPLANSTLTECSVDKPAEMTSLELPGRTGLFVFTFFLIPAVLSLDQPILALVHQEKVNMLFNMEGNGSPPLFITLHRFQRNTQKLGKDFLGFAKLFA